MDGQAAAGCTYKTVCREQRQSRREIKGGGEDEARGYRPREEKTMRVKYCMCVRSGTQL